MSFIYSLLHYVQTVTIGINRMRYCLRKVLPVVGIVIDVQNVANFSRDGYELCEG